MPTTEVGRPRVVVLRCRACHADLSAASNDTAFRCGRCGRAWEIGPDGLAERRSGYVIPPPGTAGSILHLPFWVFPAEVTVQPKPEAGVEGGLALRRAGRLRRVYVAAHSVHRPSYVGDWGQFYTRHQHDWEVQGGGGPEAPGASLGSGDAAVLAEHIVLEELDRASDLATLDVGIELGRGELLAIPCIDLGDKLRCPWTRAELPARALDDLSEIRGAVVEMEA